MPKKNLEDFLEKKKKKSKILKKDKGKNKKMKQNKFFSPENIKENKSKQVLDIKTLENWLWIQGGQASYPEDFVGKYVLPLIYPEGLTRAMQIILAAIVIFGNVLVYGYVFWIRKKGRLINRK